LPGEQDQLTERRGRPRGEGTPILGLADLEAVRLILRGGSVIDWYRLNFQSMDEVHRFIRTLELDPLSKTDLYYIESKRTAAARFLSESHRYQLPKDLLICPPLELFLYASEKKGRRRDRFFACLLLKVMHIMHHISSRELLYRLPSSQSVLAHLLGQKVDHFVKRFQKQYDTLISYSGGEKTDDSLVTKLLVKREHHAAAIHDRVRFRFVVEKSADLVPFMHQMVQDLVPFNYVVPGETVNQLVNFTALVESHSAYRHHADGFQVEFGHEEQSLRSLNEFSGPTYRVISFVIDVPIRVPEKVMSELPDSHRYSKVVFGLTEFQLVDQATDTENESGENRHACYKQRQCDKVRERLERGLRGIGDS
jgi:uncharacterized protein (TIGR04552 family)